MATQFEEQGGQIGGGLQGHQQVRVAREGSHHDRAVVEFQHRQSQGTAPRENAEFLCGVYQRRDMNSQALGIERSRAGPVDQQAIATQHDGGVHPVAATQGGDKIANGGHGGTLPHTAGEVKRRPRRPKRLPRQELGGIVHHTEPPGSLSRIPMGIQLSSFAFGAPRLARRALSFLVACVTLSALGACGDDNSLLSPATTENVIRTYSVYAMSGTSPALPAAYRFTTESLERPQILSNGGVNFDMAFDLTANNQVSLVPVRVVVPLPPAGATSLGLRTSDASFTALERAPTTGFRADTSLVVGVGQTVLVQVQGGGCFLGDPLYAKLVVDSIITAERRLVVRSLTNRNCGYRALTEGLPRN